MNIENLKTIAGLIFITAGGSPLILGILIPGYGKIIAIISIFLGVVVLFTKKNIDTNSSDSGNSHGFIGSDEDD